MYTSYIPPPRAPQFPRVYRIRREHPETVFFVYFAACQRVAARCSTAYCYQARPSRCHTFCGSCQSGVRGLQIDSACPESYRSWRPACEPCCCDDDVQLGQPMRIMRSQLTLGGAATLKFAREASLSLSSWNCGTNGGAGSVRDSLQGGGQARKRPWNETSRGSSHRLSKQQELACTVTPS